MIPIDYPAFIDEITIELKDESQNRLSWSGDTSVDNKNIPVLTYPCNEPYFSLDKGSSSFENFRENKLISTFNLVEAYKISKEIHSLATRTDLEEEGFILPNAVTIQRANELTMKLARLTIFPSKISISGDDGICLRFMHRNKILYLELYNDGETGFIIEDLEKGKSISNEDLDNHMESIGWLKEFYA